MNKNAINTIAVLLNHVDQGSDLHKGLLDIKKMIENQKFLVVVDHINGPCVKSCGSIQEANEYVCGIAYVETIEELQEGLDSNPLEAFNGVVSFKIDKLNVDTKYGRDEFMEFFRSDSFHEQMSPDDCQEVFSQVLQGESDFTKELLASTATDYGVSIPELFNLAEEDYEMLASENKLMAEFLLKIGYNNEQISEIANSGILKVNVIQESQNDTYKQQVGSQGYNTQKIFGSISDENYLYFLINREQMAEYGIKIGDNIHQIAKALKVEDDIVYMDDLINKFPYVTGEFITDEFSPFKAGYGTVIVWDGNAGEPHAIRFGEFSQCVPESKISDEETVPTKTLADAVESIKALSRATTPKIG